MGLCDIFGNPISSGGSNDYFDVIRPGFTNLWDGTYTEEFLQNNGTTLANTNAYTTGFINISGGAYLYPQYVPSFTYNPDKKPVSIHVTDSRVAFYDAEKKFLSLGSAGDATGSPLTAKYLPREIPNGAVYCRVSFTFTYMTRPNDKNGFFVGVAADNSLDTLPWEDYYPPGAVKSAYLRHENLTNRGKPLHEGKTWVLFGDSITDGRNGCGGYDWTGDNWVSRIAREFGLIVDNRAKSGSNMCISTDAYVSVSGIHMLDAFLAEIEAGTIEQPAYITIGFGANCYNTYVGRAEDTSENTTTSYYGATRYFIEKLREKCPNSVFGFILPHDVDWSGSSDWKQEGVPLGRDAIKAVCEECRVPYINMYTESGITADMLNDGVHIWNEQPKNLYYHAMRRFVMGL